MIQLFRYLKPYAARIALLVVLVVVQAMCDLQLPAYMASIVNDGILPGNMLAIRSDGIKMLGFALTSAVAAVGVGYLASRTGAGFSKAVRQDVFERVESFSSAEMDRFSTASLITRSTNDVQQVQMVIILLLRTFLSAPITGIVAIFKAASIGSGMTWLMAVAVAAVTAMVMVLFLVAVPRFKQVQKKVDRLNLVARENLTGLRVIRAFNTQKTEEDKFDHANQDLNKLQLFLSRMMSMAFPFMMLVMNLTSVAIVWLGAHLIGEGNLMVGDMIAFIQYTMQVIIAFLMLTAVFIMVPRAAVSAERIRQVLDTQPSIVDPAKPKKGEAAKRGIIEFDNVTFAYPQADEPVLQGISFTALPGQTTAFIGSTGSGKSTLINLIPRFFDVTQGRVLLGGVDVRDYTMEDLTSKIGYVPQKGTLFSGTVATNLRLGAPDATQEQLEQAGAIAQADGFVREMDKGYDAAIAQGGTNVSGGQKQRLSIARAVACKPDVFIFDDSFSALDFKTDADLRLALAHNAQDATILVVAQRIASIRTAQQIIVLEHGKIVGIGRHEQLLESCEIYKEIAQSQLTREEMG